METQKENSSYKILKYPPAYLDGYLAINGCLSEHCIPIEFTNSIGKKWVYGFKGEIKKGIEIINLKEKRYFLISTSNELKTKYIIDIETINPITEIDDVSEILEWNNMYILILNSINSIAIIQEPKNIKYYESLCWDGIKQNRIENNILKGVLYDWKNDGNQYFKTKYEIDLRTFKYRKGKELNIKTLNMNEKSNRKIELKNKWWKLW